MLNGDYAAKILGSGINAGEKEGQCPLVRHYCRAACTLCPLVRPYCRAACTLSLWSGLCHMHRLPTSAAPGVEPV